MHAWTFHLPILQGCSPATLAARILQRVLGPAISRFAFIDFCSGAGGPTPFIERALNASLTRAPSSSSPALVNGDSHGEVDESRAVEFVLTDLHPHPESWAEIAAKSAHVSYEPESVDAAAAPASLIERFAKDKGKGVFRLFNLAFHHFDDPLARAILRNTVETSEGLAIFEMQDRSFSSFVTCFLYGFFIMLLAPAFYWWSPARLFFIYPCPIIPFVLVFDGIISSLRTRTAEEVEVLLRTCGADTSDWVIESGSERFMWPVGHLNWIICTKRQQE